MDENKKVFCKYETALIRIAHCKRLLRNKTFFCTCVSLMCCNKGARHHKRRSFNHIAIINKKSPQKRFYRQTNGLCVFTTGFSGYSQVEQRGGPLPVQLAGIRLQEPDTEPYQGEAFLHPPASSDREQVCGLHR